MIAVRVALGIAVMAATLAACSDEPTTSDQQLVYVEQTAGGNPGGRIVRVAADGSQRDVLWEQPAGGSAALAASLFPSPSGQTILVLNYTPNGWFTLPGTGGTATPFTPPPDAGAPRWSPDESLIAWLEQSGTTVRLGTATPGSTTLTLLTPEGLQVQRHQWAPDGTQLAFGGHPDETGEEHIYTVARTGGEVHPVTADVLFNDVAPAWSPSGQWIAFIRVNNGVWVTHPDGSQPRSVTSGAFDPGDGLAWSPDGTEIMARPAGGGLVRINVTTGVQTPLGHGGGIASPTPWSPDGSYITYLGRTPPDVNENTGPSVMVSTPSGVNPISVSPDSVYGSEQHWMPAAR